jgi:uncharacterized repeat protein (TIGR03803 family)
MHFERQPKGFTRNARDRMQSTRSFAARYSVPTRTFVILPLIAALLAGCGERSVLTPGGRSGVVPAGALAPVRYRQLFSFPDSPGICYDGAWPQGSLLAVNAQLYGTTWAGGASDDGTVFAIDTNGQNERVLHSFSGGGDYGGGPEAGLTSRGNVLYGTTPDGGRFGSGTVFSLDTLGETFKTLHNFGGTLDGATPQAPLVISNGVLYGTTIGGGFHGKGTVFSVRVADNQERVIYSFGGTPDGSAPQSAVLIMNGTLYGTTPTGGANNDGTVFAVDVSSGKERVLYSFSGYDGQEPKSALLSWNGKFYGTTTNGGAYLYYGTVFSVDPNGGNEQTIHSFGNGSDGQYPSAPLISAGKILYGTTLGGGAFGSSSYGGGTVFSLNPETRKEHVLHSFGNDVDGAIPSGAVLDLNGRFYGATVVGGLYSGFCVTSAETSNGTVYALHP